MIIPKSRLVQTQLDHRCHVTPEEYDPLFHLALAEKPSGLAVLPRGEFMANSVQGRESNCVMCIVSVSKCRRIRSVQRGVEQTQVMLK